MLVMNRGWQESSLLDGKPIDISTTVTEAKTQAAKTQAAKTQGS